VKKNILYFSLFIFSFSLCSAQVQVNKEPQWKVLKLDSTEFTGNVNSKGILFITGAKGCLQTVYVNNMLVPQMYIDTIKIDFKEMKIKQGAKATVKAVYLKGGKVRLLPNGGLDVTK
jgi:hypothetical protein